MSSETTTISIECESTIMFLINKDIYDKANSDYKDYIFVYHNDVRISQRQVQKKHYISVDNVLGFHDNQLFPITRTVSEEIMEDIKKVPEMPSKITRRKIIMLDKYRLAFNAISCAKGTKYTLTCEIEYDQNTSMPIIWNLEIRLMDIMSQYLQYFDVNACRLEELFATVVPKLQPFHTFNPSESYKWAYKWNGVKAKCMCHNGTAFLWKDADNIRIVSMSQSINILEKICLQVEVMEQNIVIVEILAMSYNNILYTNEPHTNLKCLDFLHQKLTDVPLFIDNKAVIIQQYYDSPKQEIKDYNLHDGIIIMQDNKLIKWKYPTIDVKYIGDSQFAVGNTVITLHNINIELITGGIYEISADYVILRRRNDRIACSNQQEYEIFLQAIDILSQYSMV